MTSLLTNNAAMTALTTLKSINSQLDTTSNRVSTGQRVSTASDNAAYWSIATTVRTDNASLSAVKDSLGLGSSAVDTAYNGLNSIITDLQNIRGKLQSAMTPGVDRAKVQTEISAIQSKMKATADSSNSSGQNWLSVDSTASNSAYQATQKVVAGFSREANGNITFSMVNVDVNSIKLYDKNTGTTVTKPATAAQVVGSTSLTGTGAFSPGGIADFQTPDGSSKTKQVNFVIELGTGGTAVRATIQLDKDTLKSTAKNLAAVTTDEMLAAINNQIAATTTATLGGKVTAGLDSAGRLTFATVATGSAASIKISNANLTDATKFAAADIGFGATSNAPVLTGTTYSALNVSSGKVITVDDGGGAKTVTLNAAAITAAGSTVTSAATSVSGADAATLINQQLKTAGSTATARFDGTKLIFTTTGAGASASVTVAGTDVADFGFTSGQTNAGTNAAAGAGTASTTTTGKGILDTSTGTYNAAFGAGSYSVANFNISNLVGSNGDADVQSILNMVDKAIASVTDAGTKLGANKTQIDGQKTFVDTLMKANDRTIGILVDADVEEESTKLKALQTQQQLAVQALSIANSASQNVLSLFR